MKKLITIILSLAMTVCLAACGEPIASDISSSADTASSADNAVAAGSAGDEVDLNMVFAWWGNQTRNERTQTVLDMYSAANSGITFDAQPAEWSDYWAKLSTAAAGNALPDCIQMDYTYINEYVSNGLLCDLTPYVESGILDVSKVDPGILEAGSIDGKLYAVCAGVNAPALLYNKTLLDNAGITVKDGMTMDEFFAVSKEVYEKTGVKTDLSYGSCDNFSQYIMRGQGINKLYNPDSLNCTEADWVPFYKMYENALGEGWLLDASVYAELTLNSVEQSPMVFYSSPETQSWCGFYWSNQMTAMVKAAPEGMEIGISTWPSADPLASNFLKPSQFFSVSRDAQNPEEAAKVLNYLLNSVECNEVLLGERGVPAASDVAAAIAPKLDATNQTVTAFINDVVTPNCSAISPAVPAGASEVASYAHDLLEKLMYGEITAEQAAGMIYKEGNAIMGRQ